MIFSLASQEIPRVHNSQPLCPSREPDEPCSFNSHFNAILPSTTRSAKRSLSYRFPNQNPVCISLLLHTYHVIRLSQRPSSVHPAISCQEYKQLSYSLRSLLPPRVICSLLALNTFHIKEPEHPQPMILPYCEKRNKVKVSKWHSPAKTIE